MQTDRVNAANTTEPQVAVIDIPYDLTAADTCALVEEHSQSMYLLAVVPWPGVGVRAFFRKHARLQPKDKPNGKEPNEDDAAADAILRRYPKMPAGRVALKLAEHGIEKHPLWVSSRREALERKDLAAAAKQRV